MKKKYKISRIREFFVAKAQCLLVCSDGSGKPVTKHVQNCPLKRMEEEQDLRDTND